MKAILKEPSVQPVLKDMQNTQIIQVVSSVSLALDSGLDKSLAICCHLVSLCSNYDAHSTNLNCCWMHMKTRIRKN